MRAWLLTGIPGAGKSTVSRLLAETFERSAYLEGDRLQELIVRGRVLPGEQPQAEADRQLDLSRHHQALLAASFASAGFVPVMDFVVVTRAQVAIYQRTLAQTAATVDVHLVVLDPGAAAALQRDHDRPEKTVAAQWLHLEAILYAELAGLGLWLNTAHLTPAQTVQAILAQPERSRLPAHSPQST